MPRSSDARTSLLARGLVHAPEDGAPSLLHRARLEAVLAQLHARGPSSILDLGCGSGFLLPELAALPGVERVIGIEPRWDALGRAQARLGDAPAEVRARITLRHGSLMAPDSDLSGFDAAVLLETLEHLDPERLSIVETSLFRRLAPDMLILTTPNREFNPALGVPDHRLRHPDHRFEWARWKFRRWCDGAAARTGYVATYHDVGPTLPRLGGPTQMAVFTRTTADQSAVARAR